MAFLVTLIWAAVETGSLRASGLGLAIFVVVAVGPMVALTWRAWTRRRATGAFLDAAWALASNTTPTSADAANVATLREAAPALPQGATAAVEGLYRSVVAEMVADRRVSEKERDRLDRLQEGLGLSDAAERPEVEAFLRVHADLVGDGRLTDSEDAILTGLRAWLRVPDAAVQAQLAHADQLRRARIIRQGTAPPIQAGVKLRKGESCYYATGYREKKKRVARTYQQDGVRYTEDALGP